MIINIFLSQSRKDAKRVNNTKDSGVHTEKALKALNKYYRLPLRLRVLSEQRERA
jgi:hypothetical protein